MLLTTDINARRAFIPELDSLEGRPSITDREKRLREGFNNEFRLCGDWAWRPYRKELVGEFGLPRPYTGVRSSPRRKCAARVWMLLDAQAQLTYEPDYTS